MKQELLKGLSEEQIAKVKDCKSQEELLKLAKEEGIELTEEQLEAVSGGECFGTTPPCPYCGASKERVYCGNPPGKVLSGTRVWNCKDCGNFWKMD